MGMTMALAGLLVISDLLASWVFWPPWVGSHLSPHALLSLYGTDCFEAGSPPQLTRRARLADGESDVSTVAPSPKGW